MNNFKAFMKLLGLRDGTAAEFLDVNPRTVEKMKGSRRNVPPGIDLQLIGAYTQVYETALKIVDRLDELENPDEQFTRFTLGITTNDEDARKLGWPCCDTHAIMGALVAYQSKNPVRLIARVLPPDAHFDLGWPTEQADLEEFKIDTEQ